MDKYAVFGNPIKQSKSPLIHRQFAQMTGQRMDYTAILAPVDTFENALDEFFSDPDSKGCNVTAPFKERAMKWVDELSPEAALAGAANTIVRLEDGRFKGDNTDGIGLVYDIKRQGIDLKNRRILIVGAGGAAKGALLSLLKQNPSCIGIYNRTAEKAATLASSVDSDVVFSVTSDQLQDIRIPYDIIINSTSASLSGAVPALPESVYRGVSFVYDMVYGSEPTPFMQLAAHKGVPEVSDGLGMLVGQAAHSFYLWRNVMPGIELVLADVRAAK